MQPARRGVAGTTASAYGQPGGSVNRIGRTLFALVFRCASLSRAASFRQLALDQARRQGRLVAARRSPGGSALAGPEGLVDFLRRAARSLPMQPARMGIGAAAGTPYAQSAARWVGAGPSSQSGRAMRPAPPHRAAMASAACWRSRSASWASRLASQLRRPGAPGARHLRRCRGSAPPQSVWGLAGTEPSLPVPDLSRGGQIRTADL
jgi:hypothetical protein